MHTRYKVAALTVALLFGSVALWSGLAVKAPPADRIDCDTRDPVSSCAAQPQPGIPAGDVVMQVDLASAGVADTSLAVVRFASKVQTADIARFLADNQATMVEGPNVGGMYKIRLSVTGEAKSDLIKRMQAQSAIVDFIAAVQ
jgi:hypothetical protein